MKNTYEKLRARFAPEVRFKVDPVPFRVRETTRLDTLKDRLLRILLAKTTTPAQNLALRRAANDAAALAWLTNYPLLVFPALLEEKAQVALVQTQRQARIRRQTQDLVLKAA